RRWLGDQPSPYQLGQGYPVRVRARRLPAQVVDAQPAVLGRGQQIGQHRTGRAEAGEVVIDEEAGTDAWPPAVERPGTGPARRLGPRRHPTEVPAQRFWPGLVV